ncbi:ABC transporter permease [Kribbella sp. GL6]|uniref:ABC transporter permease n=1 Tax=Kribbella sp. GL6 TaxID=3419765 RepID=UPI003D01C500
MARLIAQRLIGAAGSLLILATAIFFLLKLVPGDEAIVAAGPGASAATIAAERARLGLDSPVFVQYGRYLWRLLHGDFGVSNSSRSPVAHQIVTLLPATAQLVLLTVFFTVVIAIPLASLSAFRTSGVTDAVRRIAVVAIAGVPTFWLALMLQNLLAAKLGILPVAGTLSEGLTVPRVTGAVVVDALLAGDPLAAWDAIQHLFLPALVLAIPNIGYVYRLVRAELVRVLARNHVMVSRAAGLPESWVIRRHVVPHALTPAIIILCAEFGGLFGGAILVESIFGQSGIGSLMMNAVGQKDTTMVEGGVLIIGAIVVASNLLADVIQLIRDPRIRARESAGTR